MPRNRIVKWAAGAAIVVALLSIPKLIVPLYANYERGRIMGPIWNAASDEERVEKFAKWGAEHWSGKPESGFGWAHLRKIIPKPFKPDKNATIFLSRHGECSHLVKAARWLFEDKLRLVQHDMIAPTRAHSAISVQLPDGRWVFVDPYLGLIFKDGERLLGLRELRALMAAGNPVEKYAIPLKKKFDLDLYKELLATSDAKDFETLDTRIRLPLKGKKSWSLGAIDNDSRDVREAAENSGLTSHLFYLGPRYSRKFRFTYVVPDDGRVYELRFHLTDTPSRERLPAFSDKPEIDSKTLVFVLAPNERQLVVDSSQTRRGDWYGIDRLDVAARTD